MDGTSPFERVHERRAEGERLATVARQLRGEGRLDEALEIVRKSLSAYPYDQRAWCLLADVHLDRGEPHLALTAAERGVVAVLEGTVYPDPGLPHRLRATCLERLGRRADAVAAARDAVAVDGANRENRALLDTLVP